MAHNQPLHSHMMKRLVGLALTLLAIHVGMAPHVFAQTRDVKGSRDHPLISRYAGSYIIGFDARDHDDLTLPLGPTKPVKGRHAFEYSNSQPVEGQVTRILYVAPEGSSSFEVMRHYEQALNKAKYQTLYTCRAKECDSAGNVSRFQNLVYPQARQLKNSQLSQSAFSRPQDVHYLAAKQADSEGERYVSLMVAVETSRALKEIANHPLVLLEVVEIKDLGPPKVIVTAESMKQDIETTGHVVLYGIEFDTGEAKIKAESESTLAEIGKLLKQDSALKLYVVGHTDNVGSFDSNMELSKQRAAAVEDYLRKRHGVAATRLKAAGVGPLAPVASNDKEKGGRDKNRRVALVKQ